MLDYFYKEGHNCIDTANAYKYGESEQWIGEWMASRNNRDEMVIATKYTGFPLDKQKEHPKIYANYFGNGTKSMRVSIDASLIRLQTTYVDIFYVHWWDFTTSIAELMQSLNDLVTSEKLMVQTTRTTQQWTKLYSNF
jgi:aryl-alcohol dehydrogenase-like predicted oxidoreductase